MMPRRTSLANGSSLYDGLRFKSSGFKRSGRKVNFYTCSTIDDSDRNASSTGRCTFEAEIRHRAATDEYFITKYVGHSFGCTALSPHIDGETRAELVDDVQMQAISLQRGRVAVQSCIDYVFRRYSYVVDEAPAASLLQCVRRRSSVATRREALKRFAQTKMRSKLQGELMTCIAHSREVITSLSLTERPTSRDIRKYYHVFGLLHTHCSRLPDFDSLATVWMAADATSSAALIHALELGIKKFDNALRTTVRRATASQTEASHNAHGHLPPYDLSEAEALTALRSITRSAQTRS